MRMPKIDIFKNLKEYEKERTPEHRYTSYDYCYNYFLSFINGNDDKQISDIASQKDIRNSCLNLGYFLASWGMFRGSGWLLDKSIKFFEPIVKYIGTLSEEYWQIDVDNYNVGNNCDKLINLYNRLNSLFSGISKTPTSTLITKIMTAVFGSVPAFDINFTIGLFSSSSNSFNKTSLSFIHRFYTQNKDGIEEKKYCTIEYNTGNYSKIPYTKAKIIGTICWIEGRDNIEKIKSDFGVKQKDVRKRHIEQVKKYWND